MVDTPHLSQAKYAATHGVSPAAASKWKQAGYLVFAGALVDVTESDKVLSERKLGRFSEDRTHAGAASPAAPQSSISEKGQLIDLGEMTLAQSERLTKQSNAIKRFIEAQMMSGSVIPKEAAEAHAWQLAETIRNTLLGWPARACHEIAAELEAEPRVVRVLLEKLIKNELRTIASDLEGHAPAGASGARGDVGGAAATA